MEILKKLENEYHIEIDVVEIIKSGAPRLYRVSQPQGSKPRDFFNPQVGDYWKFGTLDEVLLSTYGSQELGKMAEHASIRPIRVRKRRGTTPLMTLCSQILILSRLHGASLFRHPRLPITTHHADRFATLRQSCSLNDLARLDRMCPVYL